MSEGAQSSIFQSQLRVPATTKPADARLDTRAVVPRRALVCIIDLAIWTLNIRSCIVVNTACVFCRIGLCIARMDLVQVGVPMCKCNRRLVVLLNL